MPPTITRYRTLEPPSSPYVFPAGRRNPIQRGLPKYGAYNVAMSKLDEASRLLGELTNSEKAQLLKWVVLDLSDAFPGIEADPVVSGGEPCIVRTRIPVWVLE